MTTLSAGAANEVLLAVTPKVDPAGGLAFIGLNGAPLVGLDFTFISIGSGLVMMRRRRRA